jgi:nucleotide-binding universal stress UspA family protein
MNGDIASEILKACESEDCDLIVRFLLGSIASKNVTHAKSSVLL